MDRIHIWSDDRYGSNVFLSTIPTHGLKVVMDLEVYIKKKKKKTLLPSGFVYGLMIKNGLTSDLRPLTSDP